MTKKYYILPTIFYIHIKVHYFKALHLSTHNFKKIKISFEPAFHIKFYTPLPIPHSFASFV